MKRACSRSAWGAAAWAAFALGAPAIAAEGAPDAPLSTDEFVDRALQFDADRDGKLDRVELAKFAESLNQTKRAADARGVSRVPLIFSGGYETDPRDRGRPVVLIAAALGVPGDVFRDAFSRVRPAPAGTEPDPEQVRRNKSALMDALGKHGVTNERLDTVSNYYRYPPGRGQRWRATPASGHAEVKDGKVLRFVVTSGGAGYTSPPSVKVQGMQDISAEAKLAFGKDFATNGSVAKIALAPTAAE